MPRKRYTPEEIVAKLRQVEVLTSQGSSIADGARSIGVTEATYLSRPMGSTRDAGRLSSPLVAARANATPS